MAMTFQHRVLENGLTVIAETDPDAHSTAAGFFVKTGARDEPTPLMGVSHFLEHMMFKGTETIETDELNRRFDDMGARNNAYTSSELTCFYAQLLPERFADGVELLGTMMRPALRQTDFDTEKNVILEEIAMYRDNPFWVLYEAVSAKHYGDHALGHRVLGTDDTIKALERDAMRGYFEDRYSADNTVVAFAGSIDFDRACDLVSDVCASWERTEAGRDNTAPRVGSEPLVLTDERVNRAYLLSLAPGPGAADDERYAASLAAQLLGASDNSRLHWALVDTGIAEEAMAAFDPHDGTGDFYVFASGDPDRADEIFETLEREMATLPDACTEDELDRIRTKIATAATLSGERPHDRMQRIGRIWTLTGEYRSLDDELERIAAVTASDVRGFVER
ncbi:MAG: pitrilysin family protein, partial [Planctomycetota bacterium]